MTDKLTELMKMWREKPDIFVQQVFGVKPEPWQARALRAVATSDRVAIRSGRGVGKTAFLAWVILWFLATNDEAKIPCTAPSSNQLEAVLWPELGKWARAVRPEWKQIIRYVVKSDRVEIAGFEKSNFAVARTARREQPEAFQGFHAKNLMFIIDEASGVEDIIFEVGEGSMSTKGAKTIMCGNPTRVNGYFYEAFHKDRNRWFTMKVGCKESSQVTEEYIESQGNKYGEESNHYRVHVLGDFPTGGDDAIIPLHLVESAVNRDVAYNDGAVIWGVDVARFGSDRTAVVKRHGNVILEKATSWQGKDTMQTAGMITDMYHSAPQDKKPREIIVDVIGYGAGVVDRLRENNLPVRGVNVSERRATKSQFFCLRDQLWFTAREWFETRAVCICEDEDLAAELISVSYTFDSLGKKKVKDKHDIGWSPDLADAFVLTFGGIRENNGYERPEIKKPKVLSSASYAQVVSKPSYLNKKRGL